METSSREEVRTREARRNGRTRDFMLIKKRCMMLFISINDAQVTFHVTFKIKQKTNLKQLTKIICYVCPQSLCKINSQPLIFVIFYYQPFNYLYSQLTVSAHMASCVDTENRKLYVNTKLTRLSQSNMGMLLWTFQ